MLTHGSNYEATHNMFDAIEDFISLSRSLGLKLSTKGIIISKKSGAAKIIVNELRKKGIIYNARENTRDLGVDFSFYKKPHIRKHILKTRIKNSQGALNTIYRLAKISRRARVLFSGAEFSKATWGFQASGLSHAEWNKIEVAAANAAGFGKGRCRYSALCISYGQNGHPFIRAIREPFVLWFKLLIPIIQHKDPLEKHIQKAWNLISEDIKPKNGSQITIANSLHKSIGIISHIIIILTSLGWKPINYNEWTDPENNT